MKSLTEEEKKLLDYVDIPYYKNHPSYIQLWRNYYYKEKDVNILLFMFYKKISTAYYWIYTELSNFFIKKGEFQVAHFILNKALEENVYPLESIKEKILKITNFEEKYSLGDLHALLKPKNIKCLGTVWNRTCDTVWDGISKEFVNFRMQNNYKNNSLSFYEQAIKEGLNCVLNNCNNEFIIKSYDFNKKEENNCLLNFDDDFENEINEYIKIEGELKVNNQVIINDYIHIITGEEKGTFFTIKMAKNIKQGETIESSENMIIPVGEYTGIFDNGVLCTNNGKFFMVITAKRMLDMKTVLDKSSRIIKSYYLSEIFKIILSLKNNSLMVDGIDCFFLDTNFKVRIITGIFKEFKEEEFSLKDFKYLEIDYSLNLNDILKELEKVYKIDSFEKEWILHKTEIIENL